MTLFCYFCYQRGLLSLSGESISFAVACKVQLTSSLLGLLFRGLLSVGDRRISVKFQLNLRQKMIVKL